MPKNDQELFSWHKMDLRQLIKSVGNEPVVPEKHVNFCGVCTIFISCPNVFKSSQVCKLEQAIVFFLPPPTWLTLSSSLHRRIRAVFVC